MRYIFPFNKLATNVIMLIAITMSYICYPIMALVVVRIICGYIPALSTYQGMYFSAAAFLFVGVYSVAGVIAMYVSFFKRKTKK